MFNFIIYKIGEFVALHLPLKAAYALAGFISDLQFLFSRKDRVIVQGNLKKILTAEETKRLNYHTREVFRNFGRYLVEFFRFPLVDREFIEKNISLEGFSYADEALKKGKGAVAVTAHIGNWELAGIVMAILNYAVLAIVLPHKNSRVNKFFDGRRLLKGMKIAPLGKAAQFCLKGLKDNMIVAIAGDRDFIQTGVIVDFLGLKSQIPRGPAALSLKTGAPIIPAVLIRTKENKFRFIYEKPIEYIPTNNKEEDILNLTKEYLKVIEAYIKKYPNQWLMFREFWMR